MIAIVISIVLLIVLILIAVRLIGAKRHHGTENPLEFTGGQPLIHASGIYSIVRKSPREDLEKVRPREAEVRKYLASINEDLNGRALSHIDKTKLLEKWLRSLEENIRVVEQGDREDVGFYYFDAASEKQCPVCAAYFKPGQFVSRQEIFKYPEIIPPFHLGCVSRLVPHHGKENLRETTTEGMVPFFRNSELPPLPGWKKTIATNA